MELTRVPVTPLNADVGAALAIAAEAVGVEGVALVAGMEVAETFPTRATMLRLPLLL